MGVPKNFQTRAATLRCGDLQPAKNTQLVSERNGGGCLSYWVRKSGVYHGIPWYTSNDHFDDGETMIHHKIWGSNV